LITAAVTSVLALLIVRKYSNIIIWGALVAGCASTGLLAVMFFFTAAYGLALIMLIAFAVSVRWVFLIRERIPFTVAMIEIVLDVMKLFPATVLMSLSSILIQAVWNIIWIVAAVYAYADFVSSTYSTKVGAVFVYMYLILSYYWTSQVVWNSVLVTINGIFAEWYFKFPNIEPRPLKRCLKRTLTTSFGSVCLGSLLISIVKTLKYILEQSKKSRNNWATCIAKCILNCFEGVIEYINLYAFTYVAIYGMPYCDAARNVWHLLEQRGFGNPQLFWFFLKFKSRYYCQRRFDRRCSSCWFSYFWSDCCWSQFRHLQHGIEASKRRNVCGSWFLCRIRVLWMRFEGDSQWFLNNTGFVC
jgi:hypothetical protein